MNLTTNQNTLLLAMIAGEKFKVRHGMTAPYTHEFYIQSKFTDGHYCEPVTCNKLWWENLPKNLERYLITHRNWTQSMFDTLRKNAIKTYKDQMTVSPQNIQTPSRVATGYEITTPLAFVKILSEKFDGTYSTSTTISQNNLSKQLTFLRNHVPKNYTPNPKELIGVFEHLQKILEDDLCTK